MKENHSKISVAFLYDDTLDNNDGVAQQVKRLGEYFAGRGHKVIYLCGETKLPEWAGGKIYSLSKNLHVRFNGNRLSMPLFSSKRKIRNVLNIEKPDVIHVTAPYSPLMAQRVIAEAHRQNIAVVGSFHILPSGWLSAFGARLLGFWQIFSLKKISEFTSTSKNAAIFAKQAMRIKSSVVPNMVDINAFLSGRDTGNKSGQIVFLGRLVERKGCAQLIRAFAGLPKSNPKIELIIAGDGPDRKKLERLVAELGIKDRVKFLGFVDEAVKPKVLGSAQIACFPALYGESFGLVLIEAMAAGAGVVLGGNNPGYASVLEKQPQLLIDPNDTVAFTARLQKLLTNKNLANRLHDWQEQTVKQYDINVVGGQILGMYESAIARKNLNRHNKANEER